MLFGVYCGDQPSICSPFGFGQCPRPGYANTHNGKDNAFVFGNQLVGGVVGTTQIYFILVEMGISPILLIC